MVSHNGTTWREISEWSVTWGIPDTSIIAHDRKHEKLLY